jgi:hypothetical protein
MARETPEAKVCFFISSPTPILPFAVVFSSYTALERLYFSILHRRRSLLWLQRQQRAIIEVVENTKQSLLYGREREPTRQIFENNGGKLYCYLAVLQFKLKMATGFAFKFKLQRLNIWPVAT